MRSVLTASLLGPLQVTLDGRTVTGFEYDKVRALFCFLVTESDRPHRREALAGLLWPGHAEKAARDSLRQALATLRQAIGDQHADPPWLLVNRETVQFNPGARNELDVAVFRGLLADCEQHRHRRLEACLPCARRLEQACRVYRGNFLEQFSLPDSAEFERWMLLWRENLHRQALAALYSLADHYARREAWPITYQYAARQLALEPWREEACRQAMRALALDGQRSAALAHYKACAAAMATEIGVAPAAETTALRRQIEAGAIGPGQVAIWPRQRLGASGSQPELLPSQRLVRLAAASNPLIGRQAEVTELVEQLADPQCRLLTIGGPGGVGKTRLAQEVLRQAAPFFDDGAVFVPLASVSTPGGLEAALAATLDLKSQAEQTAYEQLLAFFSQREILLALDNFEHLLAGSQMLASLLNAASRLVILVTSRHRLGLQAEWFYDLAGLSYPVAANLADQAGGEQPELTADVNPSHASLDVVAGYEAVQLFIQRARQVQRRFSLDTASAGAILRICRLADGLPLAIELAAAAASSRPPAEIAEQIASGLAALPLGFVDAPERQRSIEATLAYSWSLLTPAEQELVVQAAAFRSSFDGLAARAVLSQAPAGLQALVDKSLLRQDSGGRFGMHELLRHFAARQNAGVYARAEAAHGAYYLQFLADQSALFDGAEAADAVTAVQAELDNARAAWAWAVAGRQAGLISVASDSLASFFQFAGLYTEGEATFGLAAAELAGGVAGELVARLRLKQALFAQKLGRYEEALATATQVLDMAGESADELRAEALTRLGHLYERRGDYARAGDCLQQALGLLKDRPGEAAAGEVLHRLGSIYWRTSNYPRALEALKQALAADQQAGRARAVAQHLGDLGLVYKDMGDYAQARLHLGQALASAEALGHRENVARYSQNLGLVYWQMHELDQAQVNFERALQMARELSHKRGVAICLGSIANIHSDRGDHEQALAYNHEALQLARELGEKSHIAMTLGNIGNTHRHRAEYALALDYYSQALALDREIGNLEGVARHLGNQGDLHKDCGDFAAALASFEESLALLRQVGARYYLCWVLVAMAETLFTLGRPDEAVPLNAEGARIAAEIGRQDTLQASQALAARLHQDNYQP
jgi:predicted ATPase/DNA-binding SARP family transcriptional activator